MKPIKLEMQAFGPYVHKTVVDFSKLGSNGLYLITGSTGVGKTTIFDAIVFALYGAPSGSNRKANELRCTNLSEEDEKQKLPTEVGFEFEYRGQKYTVIRRPAIFYKVNSSITNPSATLIMPDGSSKTGITEVNAQIENIIGLSKKQFSQIAMIAQGEFLKILTADTNERIEILRHIFKTERFNQVEGKLLDLKREAEKDYNVCLGEKKIYFESINCDSNSPLFEEFKNLSKESDSQDIICFLSKLIEESKKYAEDKKHEVEIKAKEVSSFDLRIKNAQDKDEQNKKLNNLIKEMQGKKEEQERLIKAYDEAKGKISLSTENRRKISVYENKLSKYDDLASALKEQEGTKKNKQLTERDLEKGNLQLEKLNLEMETARSEIEQLKSENLDASGLTEERARIDAKIDNIENLLVGIDDVKNKEKSHKTETEILIELQKNNNAKQLEYTNAHEEYIANQAGILAEELQEGKACPVCGSIHHPCKALKPEKVCTKEELDHIKKEAKICEEKVNEQSEKCGNIKTSFENKKTDIVNKSSIILNQKVDFENLKEMLSALQSSIKIDYEKINCEIDKIKKNKNRVDILETDIAKKLVDQTNLSNEINNNKSELARLSEKFEAGAQKIASLKKELDFDSKDQAIEKIDSLRKEANEIELVIETAMQKAQQCEKECSSLKGQQDTVKNTLDQIQETETVQALLDLQKIRRDELEDLQKILDKMNSSLSENNKVHEKLEKNKLDLEQKFNKHELVKSLYTVVKGTDSKIAFETYILMGYLDRILKKANQRLLKMTNDRYELVRKKDIKGSGAQGLDLNIIDNYNTTQRNVKTLSGGESFQASLSLALGLADEIQENAGGIQLDTMFVDEGFGSLDDETLRQAVSTLMALANQNKFVGIISHVNELKSRIDKKIMITKGSNGNIDVNIQADV